MIFICLPAALTTGMIKPYKTSVLNYISVISISCQIIVAIIGFFIASCNELLGEGIEYISTSLVGVVYIQNLFLMIIPVSLSILAVL